MFEMGWLLERRETVTLALVEIAGWAFLYLQERLFRPTPSQDMWFLQQTELWWDTLHPQKRAAIPTTFHPKEVLYVSVIFQRHPCSQLLEFSLFFKKTAVLGACICKPLSYLVTREAAQDAEPALFPGLHCQGQPKENWRHNQLKPLIFQPRWPREPTILEAVDLQLGLQLPQNTRPFVWVLSATLSLFGNKPRCNPLEMTKEIKAQLWSKDSSSGMLASEVAQKQAGLAHRHAFLVSFRV